MLKPVKEMLLLQMCCYKCCCYKCIVTNVIVPIDKKALKLSKLQQKIVQMVKDIEKVRSVETPIR